MKFKLTDVTDPEATKTENEVAEPEQSASAQVEAVVPIPAVEDADELRNPMLDEDDEPVTERSSVEMKYATEEEKLAWLDARYPKSRKGYKHKQKWSRTHTFKLTDQDRDILRFVGEMRYANSTSVGLLIGEPDRLKVARRLKILEKNGLLDSRSDVGISNYYFLTVKGRESVGIAWGKEKRDFSKQDVAHNAVVANLLGEAQGTGFFLAGRKFAKARLQYVAHTSEREIKYSTNSERAVGRSPGEAPEDDSILNARIFEAHQAGGSVKAFQYYIPKDAGVPGDQGHRVDLVMKVQPIRDGEDDPSGYWTIGVEVEMGLVIKSGRLAPSEHARRLKKMEKIVRHMRNPVNRFDFIFWLCRDEETKAEWDGIKAELVEKYGRDLINKQVTMVLPKDYFQGIFPKLSDAERERRRTQNLVNLQAGRDNYLKQYDERKAMELSLGIRS